jgi:hypothetical protein
MKLIKVLFLVISIVNGSQVFADSRPQKLIDTFKPPPSITTKKNSVFAKNYEGTDCINFQAKKTKKSIGFLCLSNNQKFLSDMGVATFQSIPAHARSIDEPASGLFVSTPLGQYPFEKFISNGPVVTYAASTDCDFGLQAIYRANSTCHNAISQPDARNFLYSKLLIKNEVKRTTGLSEYEINEIWKEAFPILMTVNKTKP